jgi:hypothetical protein
MKTRRSFFRDHSLVLALLAVLVFLVVAYSRSDQTTHLGTFYGNAVADWLGTFVLVVATKYFFETGSAESRKPHSHFHVRLARFLVRHSLTLVLVGTGGIWVVIYVRSNVDSKWGAVVGNVVSQWTQIVGLVLITKYASEIGSKEGH